MRRFYFPTITAVAFAAAFFSSSIASAQQNRTTLNNLNNAEIRLNGVGAITGPVLNGVLGSFITSMGNLVDANNWTGVNTFSNAGSIWNGSPIGTGYGGGYGAALNSMMIGQGPSSLPIFVTTLPNSLFPALTGDVTTTAGSVATTLATVNSNVGSFGGASSVPNFTVNAKGLVTAAGATAVVAPAGTLSGTTLNSTVVNSSLTGLGTVTSSTWNATPIGTSYGGLFGATNNAIPYGQTGANPAFVAACASGALTYTAGSVPQCAGIVDANVQSGAAIQTSKLSFTAVGASATARTQASKNNDALDARDYGAVASASLSCATDATTGIQNAINAANAQASNGSPIKVHLGPGYWCYSSLSISGSSFGFITLDGDGGATFLVKTTASGNGLTIGDNTHIFDGVTIQNITFAQKTGVTPTGGATVLAEYVRNFTMRNANVGTAQLAAQTSANQSYQAITIAGFYIATLDNVGIWGAVNDCLTVYAQPNTPQGAPTTDFGAEFHIVGGSTFNVCGGVGAHIGGGVGGIYFESGGESLATTYGLYIDTALDTLNHPNPQIFLGPGFAFDSNTLSGVYIGDTGGGTPVSAVGDFLCRGCWSSSNSVDGILTSVNQSNGYYTISGAHFENNHSSGVAALGGTWVITGSEFRANGAANPGGSGVFTGNNTSLSQAIIAENKFDSNGTGGGAGYGIDDEAPAGHTIIGVNAYAGNQSGAYRSINGLASAQIASPVAPMQSASVAWPVDFSGVSYVLNASTTVQLAGAASGIIATTENRNGNTCLWVVGGGGVSLLGQSTGTSCVTTAPTGNQLQVAYNAGSALYQVVTSSDTGWNGKTLYMAPLRTRPAS